MLKLTSNVIFILDKKVDGKMLLNERNDAATDLLIDLVKIGRDRATFLTARQ
jgi:hypothetical protein